jgi:hypothetical protein
MHSSIFFLAATAAVSASILPRGFDLGHLAPALPLSAFPSDLDHHVPYAEAKAKHDSLEFNSTHTRSLHNRQTPTSSSEAACSANPNVRYVAGHLPTACGREDEVPMDGERSLELT